MSFLLSMHFMKFKDFVVLCFSIELLNLLMLKVSSTRSDVISMFKTLLVLSKMSIPEFHQ